MQPVHELFEARAAAAPYRVAITDRGTHINYRELNESANRIAWRLRAAGAGRGTLVALCCERSSALVVGLLGILKAGAAYVPVDPGYPASRIEFILADSGCLHAVGQEDLRALLPSQIAFTPIDGSATGLTPTGNPPRFAGEDDAAYVIYTSGSTGTPKGAVVTHRNVTRLFEITLPDYGFCETDTWSFFHSFAFDFSVWEIWGALLFGGRLVIIPSEVARSPDDFLSLLTRERVTVLNQTPSAFRQLLASAESRGFPATALRLVVLGGEALKPAVLRPWVMHYGCDLPRLVNMYGITETTVHVTAHQIAMADLGRLGSPIGAPLADLRVYLLDSAMRPVPAGRPGEIYVGGQGVARGYLHRPELTSQRFVADPFGDPGDRLYRSGDLASLRDDGVLAFHGRQDRQAKLRGFRIEPGEVEAAVLRHAPVRDAVVQLREDRSGLPWLACYAVPSSGAVLTSNDMRKLLSGQLPPHMVPGVFVLLDALPLTSHGKVDFAALPDPLDYLAARQPEPQPRDRQEHQISQVWAELLGWESIRPTDNFFELGGDSMLAVRLVSEMRGAGLQTTVEALYRHPTVAELVHSGEPAPSSTSAAELVGEPDRYPASQAQLSVIFDAKLRNDPAMYQDLNAIWLADPLEPGALRAALATVAARHPALRTSFDLAAEPEPTQVVHDHVEIPLRFSAADPAAGRHGEALRRWWACARQHGFDPGTAPLLRCHVLRHRDGSCHLALSAHHAIIDGWSFAQLMYDLMLAYSEAVRGNAVRPEPVTAAGHRRFVTAERIEARSPAARAFWRELLADAEPGVLPTPLPCGGPPGVDPDVSLALSQDLVARARRLASSLGTPLKSVFLAAHMRSLAACCGTPDVTTGIAVNGRLEEPGSERLVGLYVNALPLRAQVTGLAARNLVTSAYRAEQELLRYRRFPYPEIMRLCQGRRPYLVTFNYVDFHPLAQLSRLNGLRILGRWSCDKANVPVAVELVHEAWLGTWAQRIRIDPEQVSPALARTLSDLFQDSLAELTADLPAA